MKIELKKLISIVLDENEDNILSKEESIKIKKSIFDKIAKLGQDKITAEYSKNLNETVEVLDSGIYSVATPISGFDDRVTYTKYKIKNGILYGVGIVQLMGDTIGSYYENSKLFDNFIVDTDNLDYDYISNILLDNVVFGTEVNDYAFDIYDWAIELELESKENISKSMINFIKQIIEHNTYISYSDDTEVDNENVDSILEILNSLN